MLCNDCNFCSLIVSETAQAALMVRLHCLAFHSPILSCGCMFEPCYIGLGRCCFRTACMETGFLQSRYKRPYQVVRMFRLHLISIGSWTASSAGFDAIQSQATVVSREIFSPLQRRQPSPENCIYNNLAVYPQFLKKQRRLSRIRLGSILA